MDFIFENIRLNISEIFYSIQGEGTRSGLPCVFVRLQGCELRCSWCDTPYALDIKQIESIMNGAEIIDKIKSYDCNYILFTGGEPLFQKEVLPLLSYFCEEGYVVSIETNGHQSIREVDRRAIKILDLKCPASGMSKYNDYSNLEYLLPHDEVKFVITDRNDYDFARDIISRYNLVEKVDSILLSPVFNALSNSDLAGWILSDKLKVRLQLQIHKYIWEPNKRGV